MKDDRWGWIYDHGHFEGTKFVLNEEICIDGGQFSAIEFGRAAVEDGLTWEQVVADFLSPGFHSHPPGESCEMCQGG